MTAIHVVNGFARAFAVAAAVIGIGARAAAQTADAQGKVVSLNGRVEHTVSAEERWNAARLLQPLLVAERVRTLEASRASILFVDETQVKLNAGAVLTVRQVRTPGGAPSSMELQRGEAWFRTKNPRSGLTVQTPAAAAAVRGTEINVRIGSAGETVLTVVEGAAEFFNPQGTLRVNAGEEGTALPGQAPTKRVILSPQDAVQWALYYPVQVAFQDLDLSSAAANVRDGFERLRAGDTTGALQAFDSTPADGWSRLGASMAYLDAGDLDRARSSLMGAADDAAAAVELRTQAAAVSLANGDTAGARRELEAIVAAEPTALRALVLLSSIELRQNRADEARAAAERALAAHSTSVGALVAASEAAQARFDLDEARGYLDRALALDPRDLHALVNRARIRFGTDDSEGARGDVDRAAAIAANDPQVRSLRGFIRLADGDITGARADFTIAVSRDPDFGEPHLGLGLTYFREDRVDEGLEAMLTATLLEPNVALYQSYLGKAYYQARRFPEGLSALESAKRLDPRDPTPWLYASFFLRDLNEQVAALNELRHAITLNDHRAVYRSRLLLDRDLATKNVSLAQIYRQLGFEAWGAFEALNSLDADLTNSSAHLFLAETYGGLPDRSEAFGSELLQYFLYAPVNRNSFNNFSEYTALLEQPRRQLDATFETGSRQRAFGNVAHRSGNERFAHLAFFQASQQGGSRLDRDDDRLQGFVQGKLSFTSRSDMFFSFSGVKSESGAAEVATDIFGDDALNAVILRQYTATPDRTVTERFASAESRLGIKHQWRPGSVLTAAARHEYFELETARPLVFTTCTGIPLLDTPLFAQYGPRNARRNTNPFDVVDLQIQQTMRVGRHQLALGYQSSRTSKSVECVERLSFEALSEVIDNEVRMSGRDSGTTAYLRDEIQLGRWLHASASLAYQEASYDDLSLGIGQQTVTEAQWSPRAGLAARLGASTILRAAGFRQLHTNQFGSGIAPPTVSGFVIARNEFATAKREEFNVSVERVARRAFVAVRVFRRDTEIPALIETSLRPQSVVPEADATGTGVSLYANVIAHDRVTVFGDNQLVRFGTGSFTRYDNLARAGVNIIHPRGLFARVTASYVSQRFLDSVITGLPRSGFALADVSISYELPGKRGLASVDFTNALNTRFNAIIESLSIDPFLPRRRVLASLRWRLW